MSQTLMSRIATLLPVWLTLTIQTLVGQNLLILYPDIEQGGSTLIISPSGNAMLVDPGIEARTDQDIVEFLHDLKQRETFRTLIATIATHYDDDRTRLRREGHKV